MGNKSRFNFPIPGWKAKQAAEPQPSPVPLTKAQKILGTGGGISTASTTSLHAGGLKPTHWDSRSGISIAVSESTTSHADTGLDVLDEEDDFLDPGRYRPNGWDAESDIIPRHPGGTHGLRMQRSAATIGNDYRTEASSMKRRESIASTIYSHYDRAKVPLSISQQTSNSAMAKGFPSKANSLLDMDGSLAGPAAAKKKPSRLDLSKLKPRSRKEHSAQPAPAQAQAQMLSPTLVNRSPSSVSRFSSANKAAKKLGVSPSVTSINSYGTPHDSPRGVQDSTTLSQLYDHYEQMTFREEEEELAPEDEFPDRPRFDSFAEEPTSPLTTASTISLITPLSNPAVREPNRHLEPVRKSSNASRITATSSHSHNTPQSQQLLPGRDYASSISSRNTRNSKTSKTSRTIESDLQMNSVLSLSDSDSDDGTFSDSAPKSSMSSHTNISHEDLVVLSEYTRKALPTRPPVLQEKTSSRQQKHGNFAPLNDYLAVPQSAGKSHSARAPSNSTVRPSSTASTETTTRHTGSDNGRGSRLSVSTAGTSDSHHSSRSGKTALKSKWNQQPTQEAKPTTAKPLSSTAEALDSLRELTAQATDKHHRRSFSADSTPPTSPTSAASHGGSNSGKDSNRDENTDSHNGRLMAVTKQEEALLAALRHKRAMMREDIIAELDGGDKSSVGSRRRSSASSGMSGQLQGLRSSKSSSTRVTSCAPQLPPYQPRNSSLVSSFKNLTERKDSVRRTDNIVRFADEPQSLRQEEPIEKRSSSAMSNATLKGNASGRHERVLLFLDRPVYDIDTIDLAEPSPDLSEFMDYDQDSDGEIIPESRRSRRISKHTSTYGHRPRADSTLLGGPGSNLRRQLENLPESNLENDEEDDFDFDGFSDVMGSTMSGSHASEEPRGRATSRPDSPVQQQVAKGHVKGHIRGKSSAVRLSAVGNADLYLPPEVGLWGDDG
ncbi:UDP-galactose transporter Gms1 [Pestalotiopsis sp. IQ-011]